MSNTKTVRRDSLLKKARAGKLALVQAYSFDDMMGESRLKCEPEPIKVIDSMKEAVDGVACVPSWMFDGSGGRATKNLETGLIHLRVHSNCSYTFIEID
jgi:hypothetical protein